LNDLKKLTLELIQNGFKSARDKSKFDKKIYGSKENDSEIDFEEEPGSSISTKQNNEERYQEHEDNYLFAETRGEETLRLEQKKKEMIKNHWKKQRKTKAAADELFLNEHYTKNQTIRFVAFSKLQSV
jgi:hypothetical protein